MTDLTADRYLRIWGEAELIEGVPMNGGAAISVYKGAPLIFDANVDTDAAVLFDSGVTAAAGDVFLGIAAEAVTVVAGDSDGDVEAKVYAWPTIVGFASTVFALANVGDPVYMDDSGTLTASTTGNLKIGECHWVADGFVYVRLQAPYALVAADVA